MQGHLSRLVSNGISKRGAEGLVSGSSFALPLALKLLCA